MTETEIKGAVAKAAAKELAQIAPKIKTDALLSIADAIELNGETIIRENKKDIENAEKNNMTAALIDRLRLDNKRISDIADGVRKVATLDDPVGMTEKTVMRPNGLQIGRKRVPIGVLGIIYEARPNVTADAAALALKSSNAVILRGGKEAINSNKAIVAVINAAAKNAGIPDGSVQLIENTERQSAVDMMRANGYIDVLIPRGGAGLIKSVVENATVPVIETGVGNCHTYIDDSADTNMAVNIAVNAKCSRPAVCNAMETLLVSEKKAAEVLPVLEEKMTEYSVEIRGCEKTCKILKNAVLATEEDYSTEFLDYILAVKVVSGLDEAIEHISKYSTGHSEAIVTNSYENAEKFLDTVDAAAVYVNASTRFTDGNEYGFGAEIGISTQKMHARGPMGLEALTTVKYVVRGNGQIR